MDSLTQFALGAAVAEATLGRRLGRAAVLWGGALGTLPDLDVLVSMGGVVEDFTCHRSWSHSLIVLSLLSPLLAWLVQRIHRARGLPFQSCLVGVWLVLVTHPLLDLLTVYGTQLLWPLSQYPFGLGSVFIIDPVYTLPLVLGVVAALVWRRRRPRLASALNRVALALSTAYLAFGMAAQAHVHALASASLARQGVDHQRLVVLAAPFTSLAWRVVVVSGDSYRVAYHSLLAPAPELRLQRFARAPWLLDPLAGEWAVDRLRWFSKGVYGVEQVDGQVRLSDLRMGVEPDRYAFAFVVGRRDGARVAPVRPQRILSERFRDGDMNRILDVVWGAPSLAWPRGTWAAVSGSPTGVR